MHVPPEQPSGSSLRINMTATRKQKLNELHRQKRIDAGLPVAENWKRLAADAVVAPPVNHSDWHRLWDEFHAWPMTGDPEKFPAFVRDFREKIWCANCQGHFDWLVAKYPPPTSSRRECAEYTVLIHNAVNVSKEHRSSPIHFYEACRLRGYPEEWTKQPTTLMEDLIISNRQSPGDVICVTAAVHALHKNYPGRWRTGIAGSAMELWQNNPDVTEIANLIGPRTIKVGWSNVRPNVENRHIIHVVCGDLELKLPS